MLSQSSEYSANTQTRNVVADWLLELSYGGASSGTYYFSGQDRTVTNFYHGNVLEWGQIEEAIDLAKSKSSIADVEIVLANKWANDSGLLSTEMFGGAKYFINRDVTIRSWVNGIASAANCLTVYVGRLVDIKHTAETVTLTIEKRSPWDRIDVLSKYSSFSVYSDKNILEPISVGVFAGSTGGTIDPLKSVKPAPVDHVSGDYTYCHIPSSGSYENTGAYYYEKSLDEFHEMTGVYIEVQPAISDSTIERTGKFIPRTVTPTSNADWSNPEYAIDDDTDTYADCDITAEQTFDPGGGSHYENIEHLELEFPSIRHEITSLTVYYKYAVTVTSISGDSGYVKLYDHTFGTNRNIVTRSTVGTSTSTNTITLTPDLDGSLPSAIKVGLEAYVEDADAGTYSTVGSAKIYDVRVTFTASVNQDVPQDAIEAVNSIDRLYLDNSGLDMNYTGFSGNFYDVWPHNIYRTLLGEIIGWDATGEDFVKVNGADWSASSIDTDRNWPCRWWTTKQLKLLDVLNQIQFEGGFLWVFDDTTAGREARIIYVKSSYASADHDLDGTNLSNISISITPFSEIVTKQVFNYQRHPADESRYLSQETATNSTARTNYNIDTDENVVEANLDFLVNQSDVQALQTYYDNILGEPKIIVQADLINPSDWVLQVGDIVQFSNMPYEPYGSSFASIYFMVTKTLISPDKWRVTFREVG